MTEQLSLFGERDPAAIVASWLESYHAELVKQGFGWERTTLAYFVLYEFSHYCGGTAHGELAEHYFGYDFSPAKCRLVDREGRETIIKKNAILRLLNIKDDHGDVMKGESYETEVC